MTDYTSTWWEKITGPRLLIEDTIRCLEEGDCPLIMLDGPLPWPDLMQDLVAQRLGTAAPREISITAEMAGQDQVIPSLIEAFQYRRDTVCPTEYRHQTKYLKDTQPFAGSILWLTPEEGADPAAVLRFLSDFRPKDIPTDGGFVLVLPGEYSLPGNLSPRLKELHTSVRFDPGSIHLFASILADELVDLPAELRSYAASTASLLAGSDVEQIPLLFQEVDFTREDPADAYIRLREEGILPLSQQNIPWQEVEHRCWKAQLQSAYASIEMARYRITCRYSDQIEQAIHTEYYNPEQEKTGYIWQKGDALETATDIELGTMVWMMALVKNEDRDSHLMYLPDPDVYTWIHTLTECRNALAHHKRIPPEQFCQLLSDLALDEQQSAEEGAAVSLI